MSDVSRETISVRPTITVVLAPMEGLTDFYMRQLLTELSPYDWCVTEFLRITDQVYPNSVFYRHCPELKNNGNTANNTPVHFQLLGQDPYFMAQNAVKAVRLGAPAIDINFGCPARTVNKSGGGAKLLADTKQIHKIVAEVRNAVPTEVPVSAKIRLGIDNSDFLLDNAKAIHDAGASWLTIHARTKSQGYRPPVQWHEIAKVVELFPEWKIIANGDIVSSDSLKKCQSESRTQHVMLGRAAVSEPDLVSRLKNPDREKMSWETINKAQLALLSFMQGTENGAVGRYKQWLSMTTQVYPEADALFQRVKRAKTKAEIYQETLQVN